MHRIFATNYTYFTMMMCVCVIRVNRKQQKEKKKKKNIYRKSCKHVSFFSFSSFASSSVGDMELQSVRSDQVQTILSVWLSVAAYMHAAVNTQHKTDDRWLPPLFPLKLLMPLAFLLNMLTLFAQPFQQRNWWRQRQRRRRQRRTTIVRLCAACNRTHKM